MWYFVSCVQQLRRNHGLNHVLQNVGAQLFVANVLGMLGRDDHCIHTHRLVVGVVLHRHLALAIGPQIRHQAVLANLAQLVRQLVGQRDRRRHQLGRLVGRVAEHHSLVACAAGVDAHGDVAGLLVDRRDHRAGVRIEAVQCIVIADRRDRSAHQALEVDVSLRCDLAGDDHQAGAGQRLAGHAAVGVLREAGIENRIGDLIGNLVGMPLGHRLTGKQKTVAFRQNNSSRMIPAADT